jgi:hypothetical protein
LFIRAGARSPDAELRAAAIAGGRDAAELEARTREYLASADVEQPWPALTLAAIGVFRPGAGWLGRKATDPVVSLEFAIDGDRNVLDVAFITASRSTGLSLDDRAVAAGMKPPDLSGGGCGHNQHGGRLRRR